MRKRAELEEAESCFNRAAAEEPLFVLRANDPEFAKLVRAWAKGYAARKVKGRAFGAREAVKHLEALAIAQEGEDYRAKLSNADKGGPRLTITELLSRWRQRERENKARERADNE